MPNPPTPATHKSLIRSQIWSHLQIVALPDSRFHHDYSSFIPDFTCSSHATYLIVSLPSYKTCSSLFIAPDNCLQALRLRALQDGKTVLVTTYGIRRGFYLLDPSIIPESKLEICSLLDGMELYGRPISLAEIKVRYQKSRLPLMVTGTGAISSLNGLRFGKGHGFFDLEWGMLYAISVVGGETTTLAVCHECQVVEEELEGEVWDTGCDFLVTNERVREVTGARKPTCGILWERLEEGMMEDVMPLVELRKLLGVTK